MPYGRSLVTPITFFSQFYLVVPKLTTQVSAPTLVLYQDAASSV